MYRCGHGCLRCSIMRHRHISTPRPGWDEVTYSLIDRISAFPSRSFAYACAKPRIGHHHYFNVIHHRDVSLLDHSLNPESGRANGSTSLLIRGKDREHLCAFFHVVS
ncbi:hypothetical protein OG21DRAFT_165867 [Imleria badia]|nr:hypothetical protein OG21DRAFT_165867 [Imleria badia]